MGSCLESVHCNLCHSRENKLLFRAINRNSSEGERFNIVLCQECGLVFVNPRPKREDIGSYYPSDYWSRVQQDVNFEETEIWGVPWAQAMQIKVSPILKYIKQGSILDIGSGDGSVLKFLKNKGWDCHGIELEPHAAKYSKEKLSLDIFNGRLEDSSFSPNSFDVISLFHSLEHFHDPKNAISRVYSLLKPGGFCIVEVPNFGGLGAWLFRGSWVGIEAPVHLYHFTYQTLKKILEKSSLYPQEFYTISTRTKYMAEYSESLRTAMVHLKLRKPRWQTTLANKNNLSCNKKSSWNTKKITLKRICHQGEYFLFLGLGALMDRMGKGGNLIVIAKK